ncbi:MAG: hypothetical protein GAK40_00542 [Burkholderia plantarii]|nr:MAG: hypothetical protein GAK40_00542 [Burkholderia plantarii]
MTLRIFPGISSATRRSLGLVALVGASAFAQAATPGDGERAPLAVTVQPGQSLNDVASALTPSRDPVVLARIGRALFAANPQAFMKHDPSRLKVGATLTVPPLEPNGAAVVANGASAAPGASAASGHEPVKPASAAHAGGASAATTAVARAPAAAASAPGAAPAANHAGAAASVVPPAALPGTHAHPVGPAATGAAGATGPHIWSGAIQTAPAAGSSATDAALLAPAAHGVATPFSASSAAADLAASSAVTTPAAPVAPVAPVRPASPSKPAVPAAAASETRPSSLQQLLALKNRVLMELQLHGIGKPAPDGGAPRAVSPAAAAEARPAVAASGGAASAASSTASASSASAASTLPAAAASPAATQAPSTKPAASVLPGSALPVDRTAVIAIGVAAAALILGFAFRRRKRPETREPEAAESPEHASDATRAATPVAVTGHATDAAHDALALDTVMQASTTEPDHGGEPVPAGESAAPAVLLAAQALHSAASESGPHDASAPASASAPAPDRHVEVNEVGIDDTPAEHDRQSADETVAVAASAVPLSDAAPFVEVLADAHSAQAEPLIDHHSDIEPDTETEAALPADPALADAGELQAPAVHHAGAPSDDTLDTLADVDPATAETSHSGASPVDVPQPALNPAAVLQRPGQADYRMASVAADTARIAPADLTKLTELNELTSAASASAVPSEFPADAVAALDGLDMALPPRTDAVPSLATQIASGRSDANGMGNGHDATNGLFMETPPAPVLKPLGAARFGALNLDFDLNLPSSPSTDLPQPSADALDRIAHNKLELASEYVELGDLHGARMLLQEVIDADRGSTRTAARTLLTKLDDAS